MKRPIYANLVSTLALCLAVGSGAGYAATKIGSGDIKPNAIKSKHIKAKQVKTSDLANNAVTGAQVAESTLAQVPSAANAAAVGGVTVTPVATSMANAGPRVTLMKVGTTTAYMECSAPNVTLAVDLADSTSPPVFVDHAFGTDHSQAGKLGPGGPGGGGFGVAGQSFVATIREASGRIHRLEVDAYYQTDMFGTDDCYVQGLLYEFG